MLKLQEAFCRRFSSAAGAICIIEKDWVISGMR